MNRNNILLITIGVVGLGLSCFVIASFAVITMFPGSRDNLEQIKGMMNIAGWSSIFSAATTWIWYLQVASIISAHILLIIWIRSRNEFQG